MTLPIIQHLSWLFGVCVSLSFNQFHVYAVLLPPNLKFFFLLFCSMWCMCEGVFIYVWMCACRQLWSPQCYWLSFSVTLYLTLWDRVSMKTGALQLISLNCQQAPRTSFSVSLALGLQMHSTRLSFQTVPGDLNSGASSCWSGTLSTQSSLQGPEYRFNFYYECWSYLIFLYQLASLSPFDEAPLMRFWQF